MLRPAWTIEHRLDPVELDPSSAGRIWGVPAFHDFPDAARRSSEWATAAEQVIDRAAPFLEAARAGVDLSAAVGRITSFLLMTQHRAGVRGDTLEIGVDAGWFSLVLATALFPGERHIAVDIWDWQDQNVDRSGYGRRADFERLLQRWAPDVETLVPQANSLELGDDFVARHAGLRFVSVDGGHTRQTTCSDLHLADRLRQEGGIVALDDIYRPSWSGVTAGIARYYADGGGLMPFALAEPKIYLTTSEDWARFYRAALTGFFPRMVEPYRPTQEFFEYDGVLVLLPAAQSEPGDADFERLRAWIAETRASG